MKYLKYALVILGFVIAIIVLVTSGGKVKLPFLDVKTSFKKVDAVATAKKIEKTKGKEAAVKAVEEKFSKEIEALDEEEAIEHQKLKNDPIRLAKLLAGKKV